MNLKFACYIFFIFLIVSFSTCVKNDESAHATDIAYGAGNSIDESSAGKNSGVNVFPKEMYVNASEGLRVRSSPNINGDRIGLLPHLAVITVVGEYAEDVVIDDISGKWVLMQFITRHKQANGLKPLEGWVFSGYLIDWSQDEYQIFLDSINFSQYYQADSARKIARNSSPNNQWSYWSPGNNWTVYGFGSDNKYYSGLIETSYRTSGTWQIKDNSLIFSQIEHGDSEPEINNPPLLISYKCVIIGNNTLLLRNENPENQITEIFFLE